MMPRRDNSLNAGGKAVIIVTTDGVPGNSRITRMHGLVIGNSVRARHLGRDITAGLRSLVGGEVPEYTRLMSESRDASVIRMIEQAELLGADGIVGARFVTASIMGGVAELLAYGAAVDLEDE